ncbi:MAG: C25 family cysteine peptidase [Acidobacteriota bacterium]|nr:C25 family cysteine peptidase [Acidobacteriota bacterium]MDH3524366.1 C25 family cysteine peptidase [Acidobacteriota bacterium]
MPFLVAAAILAAPAAAAVAPAAAQEPPPAWRVYTGEPGVYRLGWEDLRSSDPGVAGALESRRISLSNRGRPVPIRVADGGDGLLGPGDWIEFVAEVLPGAHTYSHEYSPYNVYWLHAAGEGSLRMTEPPAQREGPTLPGAANRGAGTRLTRALHLERDRLMVRLSARDLGDVEEPELWYWAKLTQVDRQPFVLPLELAGLDVQAPDPITISLQFRGLSSQRVTGQTVTGEPAEPDHELEISWGRNRTLRASWSGKQPELVSLPPIPPRELTAGGAQLSLRVLRRRAAGAAQATVDVVMLDWVEVGYPHDGRIGDEQVRLSIAAPPGGAVGLEANGDPRLLAYGDGGSRRLIVERCAGRGASHSLRPGPGEEAWWLVREGGLRRPARVEADTPSRLAETSRRADYVMIGHSSMLAAVQPLADFHRRRGLEVAVVDVQDVYDEFNHGILHPRAIRDFLAHAYHHWRPPRPRYVLLVGDASWDTKNSVVDDALYANWSDRQLAFEGEFRARTATVYDRAPAANDRNLVPTHNFHAKQGHAASDNWFVSVDGDDFLPDMAIGRIPVVEPEELAGIVEKTIRYVAAPEVGPWRRRALWITNESKWLQQLTDNLQQKLFPRGIAAVEVYPSDDEATNEHHQASLLRAFDAGQLLVHFVGHGGRFIWRTAPSDTDKNHDLFTLDHLDALQPTGRLPLVMSLTCHSGPFDHPNADSIAEKFLRLPDRGAIAVVSASWRTGYESLHLSGALLEELEFGTTIGDAFLRAKRRQEIRELVELYNLFGDPAVPLASPSRRAELTLIEGLELELRIDAADFNGRALLEVLAADGTTRRSEELEMTAPRLSVPFAEEAGDRWILAYLWSEESGIDAVGALDLQTTN